MDDEDLVASREEAKLRSLLAINLLEYPPGRQESRSKRRRPTRMHGEDLVVSREAKLESLLAIKHLSTSGQECDSSSSEQHLCCLGGKSYEFFKFSTSVYKIRQKSIRKMVVENIQKICRESRQKCRARDNESDVEYDFIDSRCRTKRINLEFSRVKNNRGRNIFDTRRERDQPAESKS